MKFDLLKTLKSLPDNPGVYQYFDENDKLLYVGKAKNLKKRVKSYFRFNPFRPADNLSPRIYKMIKEAKRLEYIVVENENDALILENSLIKQLKPKYNILLRDDKTYPYIYVNMDEDFPRMEITRKIIKGKNIKYFGPFSQGAREILKTIYEEIPLVQSKSCIKGKKACLYYQIGKCLAPCEGKITTKEYKNLIKKAIKLINNKNKILEILEKKMQKFAQNMQFEEAAEIRDRIKAIKEAEIYSNVDLAKLKDLDIFVTEIFNKKAVIVRIFVRNGKVVASSHNIINSQEIPEKSEIYTQAILEFYSDETPFTSKEILIGDDFEEKEWLETLLSQKFNKQIKINLPNKNNKNLINLAKINALEIIKNQKEDTLLQELKILFNLQNTPYKIETFDTSHIKGEATVGSMIVWENGKLKKEHYRHYHLEGKDEYSQMKELLTRRAKSFDKISPPDLWLIDGGAAQLNLAKEIIDSTGANVDILAISKEKIDAKAHRAKGKAKDKIYYINTQTLGSNFQVEKINLSESDKKLQFLQKLRDEAHRFAIEFHRKTKRKKDLELDLLKVKGIGKAKMTKLLNYFGSFENIKKASFEELKNLLNEQDAKNITSFFQRQK